MTRLFYLLFFASTSVYCVGQTQKNFLDLPYMEVTGSADTMITPNQIYIKILISEKDTKDKLSVEELESKMYEALKALGIDVGNKLTTSDILSNFKSYFLKNKDIMKSKEYQLEVSDAVTASKVFIALEAISISNTSIARVDHTDLENIRNLMRTKAVENSKARALALLKPLNQMLGPVIHITDNEVYYKTTPFQGRLDEVVVVGYSTKNNSFQELPNIAFEKIRVAANINAKFIIKP